MNSFLIISLIIFIILIYFFGGKLQNSTKKIINKSKSQSKPKSIKSNTEYYISQNNISQNNIIVIFCYADWCSHCPAVKEWYFDLIDKSPLSNIKFIAYEEKILPKELSSKIVGFPTILIKINDSIEIYNGLRSKNSLLTYLETL